MDGFLYSAFIQSALQLRPYIHPFIHPPIMVAIMKGANLHIESNQGLSILRKDKSTCGQSEPGLEPATLRSLINLLYQLSYSRP